MLRRLVRRVVSGGLVWLVVAASGVVAASAVAQPPVIAYVNANTGAFSLFDVASGTNLPAPGLQVGGIVKRFSTSQNGRYVVYRDDLNKIRLWDRAKEVDV